MFDIPTHPPVEFQNLIGVIAAVLQTDPQVVEALHIAELETLSSDEAIAAAEAAITSITGPEDWGKVYDHGGMFIIHDDGRPQ